MKVLFQSRLDLFRKPGGDTIHLLKTKEAVAKLGIDTEVSLSSNPDLTGIDLVHLFNLDWVRDTYLQAKNAVRADVPYVLTPIHHSFTEIDEFEKKNRFGVRRIVNIVFSKYIYREYLKNFYRAFISVDREKWYGTLVQYRVGIMNEYHYVLNHSDLILPNTHLEEAEIKKEFKSELNFRVIPAGVDLSFGTSTSDYFAREFPEIFDKVKSGFVLMVGRIEPRKNQLKVIQAMEEVNLPLLLVGQFNKFHPEYMLRVKRLMKRNHVIHIKHIPHEHMGSVYKLAKVHVLASWFETTGLVNLEAGIAGCKVVTTDRGFGKEYLKNYATEINPESVSSIRSGIKEALVNELDKDKLYNHIKSNYTWDRIGMLTKQAYINVLEHK